MRREKRSANKGGSNMSLYITGGVLLLAIAAFVITFVVYSNKIDSDLYALDSEYLAKGNYIAKENNENTTSASSSIGKTVAESKNNTVNFASNQIENKVAENKTVNNTVETKKETSTKDINASKKVEKDPTFQKPVEGEKVKEYAKDSLIYSETLKEWTTHLGIDIKAEKATVVKSAAEGTVKAIKNDPRFGLTIIIEHSNGFETRYANLLTTEFVSEGEKVKAGQTIGTVGDSSIFEIVDEPHLHFEILKNNENVNPSDFIKF